MTQKTLLLVHEREDDCRRRLAAQGFSARHALQISSYLAQSTDLEPERPLLEQACAAHGIGFQSMSLDEFSQRATDFSPEQTLVWTLTDGIAFYSGSLAPALARLCGMAKVGAEDALFALCQDKFRSGAVLQALGIPMPDTALARNGVLVSPSHVLDGAESFFVKPNRLGAKIGIYENSHCHTLDEALALSQRIYADYGDNAVIQAYVPGVNVRASWLDVDGTGDLSNLGIWRVSSQSDYQTMDDSMALYGETGEEARAEGRYTEPELTDVRLENPEAAMAIINIAHTLMGGLGLDDVFSMDFRLGEDGSVTLLEFEVCPGLPCFDFRHYVKSTWSMPLAEAMAATSARILQG